MKSLKSLSWTFFLPLRVRREALARLQNIESNHIKPQKAQPPHSHSQSRGCSHSVERQTSFIKLQLQRFKASYILSRNCLISHSSKMCQRVLQPKFLLSQQENFEFLNLYFKRQLDFSLSENIMCDLHIHHSHKSNNTVVVLNDQIFKKALFRFQTTNWYLLSVLWLLINFPGKKIAAPQSQQDKVQRITFASKQIN